MRERGLRKGGEGGRGAEDEETGSRKKAERTNESIKGLLVATDKIHTNDKKKTAPLSLLSTRTTQTDTQRALPLTNSIQTHIHAHTHAHTWRFWASRLQQGRCKSGSRPWSLPLPCCWWSMWCSSSVQAQTLIISKLSFKSKTISQGEYQCMSPGNRRC